jgi:hypothetical protein
MSHTDTLERDRPSSDKDKTINHLGVAVITPNGTYPDEDAYKRVPEHEKIDVVLKHAAHELEITNTTDWVAKVGDRGLDPQKTFAEEKLCCLVDIEYHKHEGGGGA